MAGPVSAAAYGVQAYGAIEEGEAAKTGDEFKAAELERAADIGRTKAVQTNAQMTRNLTVTLGHIDAIRAAARTDPTSPTGAAVRGYTEEVGGEQKTIAVTNILAQVQQQEADAAYMRYSGNQALLAGEITAASDVLQGTAKAIPTPTQAA